MCIRDSSWGEQDGFPVSFERVGTDDLSAWLAAPKSLDLLGNLGWDRLRKHNEDLVLWAQARVAEILGVPASELRHDPGVSMATVPLPAGWADTREEAQAIQDPVSYTHLDVYKRQGPTLITPPSRRRTSLIPATPTAALRPRTGNCTWST